MPLKITAVSNIMTDQNHADGFVVLKELGSNVREFYITEYYNDRCSEYNVPEVDPNNKEQNVKGYENDVVVEFILVDEDKELNFHIGNSGSYEQYNKFRDILSMISIGKKSTVVFNNPTKYKDMDFYEIIDFSDCEGTIGSKVSKKLLKDFKKNREAFKNKLRTGECEADYDIDTSLELKFYDEFIQALEFASNDGVIIFN